MNKELKRYKKELEKVQSKITVINNSIVRANRATKRTTYFVSPAKKMRLDALRQMENKLIEEISKFNEVESDTSRAD